MSDKYQNPFPQDPHPPNPWHEPTQVPEKVVRRDASKILFSAHRHRKLQMTREEMRDANIMPSHRDWCAHLVPPLQECRHDNLWAPWSCKTEKLQLEKCQYDLYMDRKRALEILRKVPLPPEKQISSNGWKYPNY